MTVETATDIDDLDDGLPDGSDAKSEGDDHIRLIKAVLQASFAGSTWPRALQSWADKTADTEARNSNDNILAADDGKVFLADASGGAFQLTLLAPASANNQFVVIKKIDATANAVTVAPASGTIDGVASLSLVTQYDFVGVWCDGTAWYVVGRSPQGVSDHGALLGLGDDDHSQYHNNTRGDARYFTQAQVTSALAGKSDTSHNHTGVYDPAGTAATAVSDHESTYDHDAYDAHVASTSNPHSVTAAQAGAYTSGETDGLLADKQDVLSEGAFVDGDKTKLDGIAAGAVAEGATGDAYASSHESDTTAHPATNIVNTPAGNISATTVQAAINELDTEKETAGTAASAISTHEGAYDHSLIASAVQNTGSETIAGVKTFSSDPIVPDEAYGVGWNGVLEPPTKNAVYGKIESLSLGGGSDTTAVHTDTSGEIAAVTEKTSLATTDTFLIEDSEDTDSKASVQIGTLDARYVGVTTTSARDMFKLPYAISDTNPPSAAVQATNTYTLTNNPSPGDTVTLSDDNCVGSFVITFDTDVTIGGSIAATVTNLVDYLMTGAGGLNYFSTPCTFNDNGADFEVTAWVAGDHMNTYRVTFDIAAGNPTNNGDALSGGVTGLSAWNMPIGASATYSTGSEQSNLESVPVSGVSVNFNYIYPAGYPRCHFLANTTDPLTLIKDNLQGSGVGMPFQVPVAPSWRTSEISTADNNTMIMFPVLYETGKDDADPYHYEYVGAFHMNFATVVNGVTAPSARILYATSSRAALNAGSPSSPRSYWQQHPMGLGHTNFAYTDPTNAWNGATLYPSWPTAAQLPCIPYSASELQEDTAINRAVPVAIGGDLMAHSSNVGSDAATVIWPASGRDANHSLCSGWVPYGSRICIDKDFDIDAYCDANACGDITRKVLHGWQDWGMIVVDIGGADSRLDFWVSTDCDSSTRSELQTQISAFRYANPDAFVRITNTAATQLTAGGGAARAEYFSATFTGTPGTGHNPSVSTGGGAVSSVFGRAGAVTQQVGDYTSAQITQADGESDIVVGYPIWLSEADTTGTTNFTRGAEQIAAGIAAGAKAFSLMPAGGHFIYDGTFRICGAHTGLDGDGGSGSLIEGIPLFANGCTLECPSTRTSANYEPLLSPQLDGSDYAALSDFFVNDGEPYIWGPGINTSTKVADTSFSSSGSDWTYDTAIVPLGMAKDNAGVMTRLLQVSQLDYNTWVSDFTAGETLIGQTSGATARIVRVVETTPDTAGELYITSIKGTFQNGETLYSHGTDGVQNGEALANGTVDPYPTTLADDEWALTATPGVRVGLVNASDRFWLVTNDAGNVIDQGGRLIDYDVFFDVCATARFHVVGPLTLIVPRDQYVVALAASRQGPKDSRGIKSGGRENIYDNITIVNAPIGLANNPIGSPYWDGDAAVYADEDGQVPTFSAATIGHLACTDVIRPIVCSSDRSDNFTILSGSMNGVRASSIFHGVSGTHIGPIRGTFNSETASGTSGQDGHDEPFFEFLNGSYNIVNLFVHSSGAAPTTAGMAGIIRAAKCSIVARNIKHDNTAGRDDYPWFVILDKPRNLFSRLGAGDYQLHFDPNMTLSVIEGWVTAAVALTSYNYTGGTRNSNNVTVRMPFVDVADIEAVEIIGSETTADTFYVETRDANQHYRVVAGALVPCDANGQFKEADTIAALTALPKALLTDKQITYVKGYYATGDGGEGHFGWNASSTDTENGGTILEADEGGTGRWERLTEGLAYSVKWFGAKGDGATDDGVAVRAALVAADAADVSLYVPAGTFVCTTWASTPTMTHRPRLKGEGTLTGTASHTFVNANVGVHAVGVTFSTWAAVFDFDGVTGIVDVYISGVKFNAVAQSVNWTPSSWTSAKGLKTCVINDCVGSNLTGTFCLINGRWDHFSAQGNIFYDCKDRIFDLGADDDTHYYYQGQTIIDGNELHGLTTDGVNSVCMIKVFARNPRITNNIAWDIVGSDSTENWGIYTKSENGVVGNNAIYGLRNDGSDEGGGLFGINIKGIPQGITTTGADLTKGYGMTVTNNHVVMVGLGTGIRLYCSQPYCAGNRVEGAKVGINCSPSVPMFHANITGNRLQAGAAYDITGSIGIDAQMLGSDVKITNNQCKGYKKGIEVTAQALGIDDVDVSGNTVEATLYGLSVAFGSASAYFRILKMNQNIIKGDPALLTYCIRMSGAAGSTVYQFSCLDNVAWPLGGRFTATKLIETHNEGVKNGHFRMSNYPYETADAATTHTIATMEMPEISRGWAKAEAYGFDDATDHVSAVRTEHYKNTGSISVVDTAASGDAPTAFVSEQQGSAFGVDSVWLNQTGDQINVKVIGIAATTVKWSVNVEIAFGSEDNDPSDNASGTASDSTDANGEIDIAHGLGATPSAANAWVVGYLKPKCEITAVDATNITVTLYDRYDNSLIVSDGPYSIRWEAR